MAPTTLPKTELTPDLIDQVMSLSQDNLGRLIGLALDQLDGPPENPEAVKTAWQAELARRWELIQTGAMPTYTAEEAIAYARQRLHERKSQ